MPYTVKGKCIFKKDTGAKVGCTKGDVNAYLAALHANANANESIVNEMKGGKAENMSVKDIANKHNVSTTHIQHQISKGKKVEKEHTNNPEIAKEIAMDHLTEIPDYYDRLEKMEKKAGINEMYGKTLIKKLLKENVNRLRKNRRTINEQIVKGKTIVNVDIQPEYQSAISFNMHEWVNFINESSIYNRIVFLFNGYDTLGMINTDDYKYWLLELGINEEVIDAAIFYDKGYAFFRYCMDKGIDENNIADLVRFMYKHNINDSRMINNDMWNSYMQETNHTQNEVREILENADDMINIPDLIDFIKRFNNIILTGGGIQECLKEVEIALLALNKPFNILSKFTY